MRRLAVSVAWLLLLSACCSELRKGKECYNEGMLLLDKDRDHALEQFERAKIYLIDAVTLCGMKDPQKVQPLTLIARIYMEEDNLKMSEEYLRQALEKVEPQAPYRDSDPAMLALVKGDLRMREAQTAILNAGTSNTRHGEMLKDQALRTLTEALTEYFYGSEHSGNATIERMLDLRKIHAYLERAKVLQLHTKGTKRESLEASHVALRAALEIVTQDIGKHYVFEKDFEEYKRKIKEELLRVEKELKDTR